MKKSLFFLLLVMLLSTVPSCGKEEEKKPAAPAKIGGNVHATEAYRTYFGEPPVVAEGSCYALVGFYPLADEPGRVAPFPMFMFNSENQLQVVTQQLLSWGEGWNMGGVAVNPFPAGTELLSLAQEQDMVRIELSPTVRTGADSTRQKLILAVLGHTLTQFEGVNRVMVVAGGELLPFQAEKGFIPDPAAVVPPGTPKAISVVGVWEKDAADPQEVSIFFDRPVKVGEIQVSSDGKRLDGEYFQSVFDMAVVIRPKEPASIKAGMPMNVEWKIEDRLGRKGEGKKTFALARMEHQ